MRNNKSLMDEKTTVFLCMENIFAVTCVKAKAKCYTGSDLMLHTHDLTPTALLSSQTQSVECDIVPAATLGRSAYVTSAWVSPCHCQCYRRRGRQYSTIILLSFLHQQILLFACPIYCSGLKAGTRLLLSSVETNSIKLHHQKSNRIKGGHYTH